MKNIFKVDVHSHILPDMDDGSRDAGMTYSMLEKARDDKIDYVCATPHFYGWRESIDDFISRREKSLDSLDKDKLKDYPSLIVGAEVAYYTRLSEKNLDPLCYDGTRTLLLEMPMQKWKDQEINDLQTLTLDRGYNIILAHFERYYSSNNSEDLFNMLDDLSIKIQINAKTLNSFFEKKKFLKMFKNGRAHVIGSDCHNLDYRKPNIGEGRKAIIDNLGEDVINRIDENGMNLLNLR